MCVFEGKSDLFFLSFTPPENAKKNRRISSAAMILELKMHARNMRARARARTNFQARFDRDAEDVCARVLTKLSRISCFFGVFFKGDKCSLQKSADARIR